mmetsp:Transcript_14695/g.19538  ORF Transcript_14695/g.19538 Transcript_14695/m.19538 type:complete len:223 (+) Transcript_14695:910-1578(+)
MKLKLSWYAINFINYAALFETSYCALTRSIELTAKTHKDWAQQDTKITRGDVYFIPSLQHLQRVLIFIKRAKQCKNNPHNDLNPVVLNYDPLAKINAAHTLQQLFHLDPTPPHTTKDTPLIRDPQSGKPITQNQFFKMSSELLEFSFRNSVSIYRNSQFSNWSSFSITASWLSGFSSRIFRWLVNTILSTIQPLRNTRSNCTLKCTRRSNINGVSRNYGFTS